MSTSNTELPPVRWVQACFGLVGAAFEDGVVRPVVHPNPLHLAIPEEGLTSGEAVMARSPAPHLVRSRSNPAHSHTWGRERQ